MERIARATGFMQRAGKLSPKSFLMSVLFQCFSGDQRSLNDHLVDLKMKEGISIRKQSLHERFNSAAVAFFKHLLESHLKEKWSTSLPWKGLKKFKAVMIADSVRFQLPEHLKERYPGNGGAASSAGAHLQFEFDLKSGNVKTLSLHHAQYQDQKAARDQIDRITENSLIIRDLGYFVMNILDTIHQKKAYFISRLKPKTTMYEKKEGNYIRVEANDLYTQLKETDRSSLERDLYIGPKKIPVRLLAERLPKEVVEERLRRAQKEAKRKGKNISELFKSYLRLNIFITNVPAKDLSIEQVHELYRLRWQIELVFKTWKSYFHFHRFKKMSVHRIECYLYASLLFIVTGWELYHRLSSQLWKESQKLISKMKFAKAWVQYGIRWRQLLNQPGSNVSKFIDEIKVCCLDFLIQEKRKNRYNLEDYLQLND